MAELVSPAMTATHVALIPIRPLAWFCDGKA
jgi:hypothetical protein